MNKLKILLSMMGMIVLLTALTPALGVTETDAEDILTPDERAWLTRHDGRIRYAPSPSHPPIGFMATHKQIERASENSRLLPQSRGQEKGYDSALKQRFCQPNVSEAQA